jgi:membrane-associated phospholipid phosphatase
MYSLNVTEIIKKNRIFFLPYIILLIISIILIITQSKADIHIAFNSFHNSFLDTVMPFYTYLGDGAVSFVLLIVFLFIKYRFAVASAISNILVIVSTYLLKQIIFNNEARPRKFFSEIYTENYILYFVPGTNPEMLDSFPSGHSTTAFATYFLIAAVSNNQFVKVLMLFFAVTIGYSRIYMSNHFLQDVVGGSFLGIILSILGLLIASGMKSNWAEKSLLTKKVS